MQWANRRTTISGFVSTERIAFMFLRRSVAVKLSAIDGLHCEIHVVGFVVYLVEDNICAAISLKMFPEQIRS